MRIKTMTIGVALVSCLMVMLTVSAQQGFKSLEGKPAPEWSIVGAVDKNHKTTLADYKGKWVLIEFWFPG